MFEKTISILFWISTLVFLLGGLAIVAGQAGGIIAGNGDFVTSFEETLAPWAYGASGVAGLLAFVLMYFHPEADYTGAEHDDEHTHNEHADDDHSPEQKDSVARHTPELA